MTHMTLKRPTFRTSALTLLGLAAAFLLFCYFALPGILQTQAEKYVLEKTGHHLAMDKPGINPFKISLHLSNVRLAEPDGKPLLSFRDLVVDLSASSLIRRALVFDDIRLDGLKATAVLLPDGRLNWSAFLNAFKSKQKSDSPLPRFDIDHFLLSGARLEFTDTRTKPVFATHVEPINLELTGISSLPNDMGQYRFSAHTSFGAEVSWHGEGSLTPLILKGAFSVSHASIAPLADFLKGQPILPNQGVLSLASDYDLRYANGKLDATLAHIKAELADLKLSQRATPFATAASIKADEGSYDLAKNVFRLNSLDIRHLAIQQGKNGLDLDELSAGNLNLDLANQNADLGSIILKGGQMSVTRDAKGRIDIANPSPSTPSGPKPQTSWRYHLDKFALSGFSASFKDETTAPYAKFALHDIALDSSGISDNLNDPVPLKASFKARDGGSFEAEGKIIPALPSADFMLRLAELNIVPAQPYLFALAKLKLTHGALSSAGHASYDSHGFRYQGDFALNDLDIRESDNGDPFLALKLLGSRSMKVTSQSLDVGELNLTGLDTRLIINKDKTLSFKRILRPSTNPAPAGKPGKPFAFNIDRLRIERGEMDYADYSLTMPFGTRIHRLKGIITNLSSRPGAIAEVKLDGRVDKYGMARATGKLDLFNPTDSMDLDVIFRNIEMANLTPYSATFAGRKITSGKLDLDLQYQIHQRQLEGKNQIIMKQLTLGSRVASPEAKDLPLDLAISILEDSDGRIDLDLPMSGSLDDPKFSYGAIIWKAIENVIVKIVTAPFRALGALFGGGEKFENIVFEAGRAQLEPPEQEKLANLASALIKRPNLSLDVAGVYSDTDRTALQDRNLRRAVIDKSGQQLEQGEDPGPLAMDEPRIRSALEKLFSEKFGSAELSAYKDAYRKANPGKLEEGLAGKLASGVASLFQKKRVLDEQQVLSMKGADFYTLLFNRLRDQVAIGDDSLKALADARAAAIDASLKKSGVPAERLSALAVEKVAASGQEVPIKLVLKPTQSNKEP
jgi:hypothetical protein